MKRFVLLLSLTVTGVLLTSAVALAAPGSLDPSFDGDGKVITDFAPSGDPRDEEALDVAVQPDGKLVAVGYAQTETYREFSLARYTANGSLDTSFGLDGKVTTDIIAGGEDRASELAIQPDGKIVVAGASALQNNEHSFALARYNADGSLDTSFGSAGKVTMDFGCCSARLNALALQPDGKIVIAGSDNSDTFFLARYDANGVLDTSFDSDGKVITDFDPNVYGWQTEAWALAIQPDGKIVAAGGINPTYDGYTDFALARYNLDGSLDNSFDGDGKVVGYITSRDDYARAMAIQPDGKIVAGGSAGGYGTSGLARYNPDGSLDTSFGTGGKAVSGDNGSLWDLALEPSGKIVTAGDGYSSTLTRYNLDGTKDASFAASSGDLVGYYPSLVLQRDGKAVVAGNTYKNVNGAYYYDFALARHIGGDDTTPPNTTITSGPSGTVKATSASFGFSSEPGAKFQCSLDGSAFAACTSPKTYSGLKTGSHTFRVRAADNSLNTDPTPASRTWRVDTVLPTVSGMLPKPTSITTDTTPTIKATITDNLTNLRKAHIKLYVNDKLISATKYSYSAATDVLSYNSPRLSKGKKTVRIVARDAAGNVGAKSWYFTIK